jgi:hypothetical protein
VWDATKRNGDSWGDIIPDKATDGSNVNPDPQLNYSGVGLSIYEPRFWV